MKLCVTLENCLRVALIVVLFNTQVLAAEDLQPRNSAVALLIQKARSLEARDRDDLAAQVWHQVLIADPNQPDALAGLARWAQKSGRNGEANTYLSRLHKVSPDSPVLTKSESSDPANKSRARLAEASALAASGRSEEAIRAYREVFGATPPDNWAVAYYQTLANTPGGYEPAVAALRHLESAYPDMPEYQLAAGQLMTFRPATRQAGVAMLSSISGSTITDTKARDALRQALLWEKSNPAFAPAIQAYLARYPDPELQAASSSMKSQAASVVSLNPESPEERLGYQALNSGNLAQAEHDFAAALAKNPASERAQAGLGYVHMKSGDFGEAVQEFEAARKNGLQDPALRASLETAKFFLAMRLGSKAADTGNWSEAVSRYETALALRPNDPDALRAIGGAFMVAGSAEKAIPYLTKAVHMKPADESAWCALLSAKLTAKGGQAALDLARSVPEPVSTKLANNLEWQILEVSAYADGVDNERAQEMYHRLLAQTPGKLTPDENIRLAGQALQFHESSEAVAYAQKAADDAPQTPGGWEVLLPALISAGRTEEAGRAYTLMPAEAKKLAMSNPAFLDTLASLKESTGDLNEARDFLEQSLLLARGSFKERNLTPLRLHLARLMAKQGKVAESEALIASITANNPNDLDAWRARLLILQTLGKPGDIIKAATDMPKPVAARMTNDGDMVSLLARAHASVGDSEFAARILEAYIASAAAQDSVTQRLQLGWLLLESPSRSTRLYAILNGLNGATDLTADQRRELATLWTTWILRSADAFHKNGNEARAIAVLQQGVQMFPNNVEMQRALAGDLLAAGKTKAAFAVYSNWGLSGAEPDDYAGAIGAALTERNSQYADPWINRALSLWPHNPKILELAGEGAQAHGDLKRAESYWKEALVQRQAQSTDLAAASSDSPTATLETLLVSNGTSALSDAASTAFVGQNSQSGMNPGMYHAREDFVRSGGATPAFGAGPATQSGYLERSAQVSANPVDLLEDKIAAVESRDTPYVGSNMSVWSRSGQPGFSRLSIEQAQFEASKMFTDAWRVSLLIEPTYLASGSPDGSGTAFFGRQTSVASFGPQSANGIAAELQLSSDSVGIRAGSTPQGFLTRTWMGGLRIRPKKGPITIILERDSVKDSLLAFAGARDPSSGQIWGGVMANTMSVNGRWGNDRSGVYVTGAYQYLDGLHVLSNSGVNGDLGTWWRIATFAGGNVTAGMNFSAMHYENNLRYFTFGQGGYFSPQQYFLFSAPISWTGVYQHRLQYMVSGSLGLQHFVEDGSDYYPTDAALQAATGYRYQPLQSTGANFNLNVRLNYQMSPHWLLSLYANANNARDYTASSVGIFAKYTFEERPLSFDNPLPSVPDWRGQQPFSLQ